MLLQSQGRRIDTVLLSLLLFLGCRDSEAADSWNTDRLHWDYSSPQLITDGVIANEQAAIKFSSAWEILGPFRVGTRESAWGADPLEVIGGFRSLNYDPKARFRSSLTANATVGWSTLLVDDLQVADGHTKATIVANFPDIDWGFIQSVYGWPALQYQAWARGYLQISGETSQTVSLFTDGLLELWIDRNHYFGGDFYSYRRTPIILTLDPGSHVIDLRLIRDVRAHGGLRPPEIKVSVEVQRTARQLSVDAQSLLVSEVVEGRLASPLASINVRNDMAEWIEILWIRSISASNPTRTGFAKNERRLRIAPSQSRPLMFNIIDVDPSILTFPIEIGYRPELKDAIYRTAQVMVNLSSTSMQEAQKVTYLHPSGIVSYAIIRPPPLNENCRPYDTPRPILLSLHGAGVEADSSQVRHTLDGAYGVCAWILFPSGVTPWSSDDYHTWGSADIRAAVAAIPDWIRSVAWTGPGVSQDQWLVSGHSNGGQGAWFLLTHHPDKIVAGAPVSGYSSIDNYVPFSMWRESEPQLKANLRNALGSFKHELLLENLVGIPIMQQHGSLDDNVPPYHSRLLADLISESGWSSDYHELPGQGHWFDGVMTTAPLVKFYEQYLNEARYPALPMEFSITVPTSGDMDSKGSIMVDQLETPDRYGHIQVMRSVTEGLWYLKTQNIHRFHFTLRGSYRPSPFPSTLVTDDAEASFSLEAEGMRSTWFVKAENGSWKASQDDSWQGLSQRYGRQVGSLDAFLRSSGGFTVQACSPAVDEVALQISRNLFQYLAADAEIFQGCVPAPGSSRDGDGNVVTVAMGTDLPPSGLATFPIRVQEDRLSVQTPCGWASAPVSDTSGEQVVLGSTSSRDPCEHHYRFGEEPGMGAVFLRPLEDERLELVVWGVDAAGVQQAARLIPILTGVGQPDFAVLSGSCRWKGHAGALAAGFLDRSWQISRASYLR